MVVATSVSRLQLSRSGTPAALARFCHRWNLSATCTASGALVLAPSVYDPDLSLQITSTPGRAASQSASGRRRGPESVRQDRLAGDGTTRARTQTASTGGAGCITKLGPEPRSDLALIS